MQKDICSRLLRLNQEFYQTFAEPFSDTRGRVQPGVQRVIAETPANASVLDLGCGNGSLAIALAQQGHQANYVGLDASAGLIEIAAGRQIHPDASFAVTDLGTTAWLEHVPQSMDRIYCFATLHHLPGAEIRTALVQGMASRLTAGGRITVSAWNFLESEKLRDRILPWETIGLRASDVDMGDYLLDWRRGGIGYRYVHYYAEQDLARLAARAGLQVVETFLSDGNSGSLGLYQTWQHEPV